MTTSSPHGVFSLAYIDSQPLPVVSRELLPWLLKDRREAEEGSHLWDTKAGKDVHDGSGLRKARQSLKAATNALADSPTDPKVLAFLTEQRGAAAGKVAFYEGKCHLLDRIIAATKAAP